MSLPGVEGACLLPAAPIASPAEPSVPSAGHNADVSLSVQCRAKAGHSSALRQSSSEEDGSLQSPSSQRPVSTAASKRKPDGRASQSREQHRRDSTSCQVKRDLRWVMPGSFLLHLRSEGAA